VDVAGRDAFRVTWMGGWFVGICYSLGELESLIGDLSGLEEAPGGS
jgi:hypothetical protein